MGDPNPSPPPVSTFKLYVHNSIKVALATIIHFHNPDENMCRNKCVQISWDIWWSVVTLFILKHIRRRYYETGLIRPILWESNNYIKALFVLRTLSSGEGLHVKGSRPLLKYSFLIFIKHYYIWIYCFLIFTVLYEVWSKSVRISDVYLKSVHLETKHNNIWLLYSMVKLQY